VYNPRFGLAASDSASDSGFNACSGGRGFDGEDMHTALQNWALSKAQILIYRVVDVLNGEKVNLLAALAQQPVVTRLRHHKHTTQI